jgi:formate dehydrogenase assembly factor FdhD
MNRPLQRDTRVGLIPVTVNATCKASRGIDERRLICVAEETPVAFRYNGFAHAVMMATADDLEDFAIGCSLSEGIIEVGSNVREIAICPCGDGMTMTSRSMR